MKTFMRFVLVGVINSGIGYALIFFFMLVVGLSPFLSNFLGYGLGLCISFAMHKWFSFRSAGSTISEFSRYLPVFGICYLLNLGTLFTCINWLEISDIWAQLIAGAVYVGSSFLLNKWLVFNRLGMPGKTEHRQT